MKLYGIATKIRQVEGHGSFDEFFAIKPVFIDREEQMPPLFYNMEEAEQFIQDNSLSCKVIELKTKSASYNAAERFDTDFPCKPFDRTDSDLLLTQDAYNYCVIESCKEGISLIEYIEKNKEKVTINHKKQ